jgi:hypothetical protein
MALLREFTQDAGRTADALGVEIHEHIVENQRERRPTASK